MPDPTMDTTPHLALPLIAAAQAQKHVTHNDALLRLDSVTQLAVVDRTHTGPPATVAVGERYLVATPATGAFAGHGGDVAMWDGAGWNFVTPSAGWRAYVAAERSTLCYDGAEWSDGLATTPHGGYFALRAVEEQLTLAGSFVASTILIPNRAICLGVASRTVAAVTGASAYEVGIAGETSKFGGSLGVSVGASNIGVIGPQAFYSDTPLRITALGGAFTGGAVRLVLYLLAFSAPNG